MKKKTVLFFAFGLMLISTLVRCASYIQRAPQGTWRSSTATFCAQDSIGKLVEFTFLTNEKIKITVGTRTFTLAIERIFEFDQDILLSTDLPFSREGEFSSTWTVVEGDYLFDVYEYNFTDPETKLKKSQVILRFLENKGFLTCNDGEFLRYMVLHRVAS